MKIGQFIYLKSSTLYADIYDVPTIQGTRYGFTSGYVGKITKLNVAGAGESQTYTQLVDVYGTKYFFPNIDADLFDFLDTEKKTDTGGTPEGNGNTKNPNNNNSGGSTISKIADIFAGLLSLFGKSKTPDSTTNPSSNNPTTPPPPPVNNEDTGIKAWIKKNSTIVIVGVVVVVGGIIWAIVAAVKSDKKDKEFQENNQAINPQKQLR